MEKNERDEKSNWKKIIINWNFKESEEQTERLKGISGGLEELNHILSLTQKKIEGFKVRCGSITSLIKTKVGSIASNEPGQSSSNEEYADPIEEEGAEKGNPEDSGHGDEETGNGNSGTSQRKSDLSRALDNHVDKLDKMLEKAENAQISMAEQTKQMKKFLK